MASFEFAFLFARHGAFLTQTPFAVAVGLLGGCLGIAVIWTVAEKLQEVLPAVMHCNVCGSRLPRRDLVRNLRHSPTRTYPFRLMDGRREEQPVRSLCTKCSRRAQRLRRQVEEESAPMAEAAARA